MDREVTTNLASKFKDDILVRYSSFVFRYCSSCNTVMVLAAESELHGNIRVYSLHWYAVYTVMDDRLDGTYFSFGLDSWYFPFNSSPDVGDRLTG